MELFQHKIKKRITQNDLTRTESTMVMSRLHTAMEMKPVRSSLRLPALSIRKNLKGKNNTVVTLLTFLPSFSNKKCNTILLWPRLLNHSWGNGDRTYIFNPRFWCSLWQNLLNLTQRQQPMFLTFTDKTVEFILSS